MSLEDADEQTRTLGVKSSLISIEGMFTAALAALADEFAGKSAIRRGELQSRCRMLILMGISNKTGRCC